MKRNPTWKKQEYFIYSFWDETSSFDPKSVWNNGGGFWEREYKCKLPIEAKEWSQGKIDHYIDNRLKRNNFWVD